MNLTEFVHATATAVSESIDIVLADEHPVNIIWGVSTEPDTIVVTDSSGDVWKLQITRLEV